MTQILLSFRLRRERDALTARQRARQLAALLGFDFCEQATIAAGVFAVAWQVLQLKTPLTLSFALENKRLRIFAQIAEKKSAKSPKNPPQVLANLQINMALPPQGPSMPVEDLVWTVQNLEKLTPPLVYEEIYRQNQELLATLHALRECQALLHQVHDKPTDSSAA